MENKFLTKLLLIHILAALFTCTPSKTLAMDYDVDWPRTEGNLHVLAITVNGCETLFKVKTEDLEAFSSNKKALQEALEKATARANSGCKN